VSVPQNGLRLCDFQANILDTYIVSDDLSYFYILLLATLILLYYVL
jgi:hypothetical protein